MHTHRHTHTHTHTHSLLVLFLWKTLTNMMSDRKFLFSTFKNRWIPSFRVWGLWEPVFTQLSWSSKKNKTSFWSWVVGTPHCITISSALSGEEWWAQALLQCCSRFNHGQASAASPGREFWSVPCPGPTELESLGWGPACCVLTDSPLDSYTQKLEKH